MARPAGRLALAAGLVLCAMALWGCGGEPVDGPPPAGLVFATADQVAAHRQAKDRAFASDPDSPIPPPARASFTGLAYYPFDDALRFKVRLRRYPGGLPLTLRTTGGVERPASKVGYVEFEHGGQRHKLTVYHLDDLPPAQLDELFLPFLDATSGNETYGAGRYIDLAPGPDGWYVLDFNLAYQPFCAYGRTDYVCPRTPEENRLPFAVRAGERGATTHGR